MALSVLMRNIHFGHMKAELYHPVLSDQERSPCPVIKKTNVKSLVKMTE